MFTGVYTAFITPFDADGKIDFTALTDLLDRQIEAGINGLVLLGTTAETATLTGDEKKAVLDTAVRHINGRVPFIIGAGTNATATTVEQIRLAKAYRPEGVLVVTPYYNKPNPAGLIGHFQAAGAEGVPLVLYHIPGRTGLKVPAAVMDELLAAVPQIKAVKESDYDWAGVTDFAVRHTGRVQQLCGNDDLFTHFLAMGASGIISAAANVLAPAFVHIYKTFQTQGALAAWEAFRPVYPLIKACYWETNPVCIKYLFAQRGLCRETVRLPLGPVRAETAQRLTALAAQAKADLFI